MRHFSPSTLGFYSEHIHGRPGVGSTIPSDAVPISDETHREVLDLLATGKILSAGEDGQPVVTDRPAPDPALVRAAMRRRCVFQLQNSAWTQASDATAAIKAAWAPYRVALWAILEKGFDGDPAAIVWPKAPE